MALSIAEVDAISTKYFDPGITVQVYEKDPLFARLKSKDKVGTSGGTSIQFAIRHTTLGRAEAVEARDQVSYTQKETRTAGEEEWKKYIAQAMLQWDEKIYNAGKAKIVDLLKDKAEEMMDDLYAKFQTDLYATSQVTKSMNSILTIVDSSTSLAGIAVADASAWAAIEDSTTTVLSLYGTGSLSYQINQATFGSEKPDLGITTRDIFSKAESLVQPQQQYSDKKLADAGFNTFKFHGLDLVSSASCPSGYLIGLDTDFLEFRVHDDFNFVKTGWESLLQAGLPHARVKLCTVVCNLIAKMRKVHFKMTALDWTK